MGKKKTYTPEEKEEIKFSEAGDYADLPDCHTAEQEKAMEEIISKNKASK